MDYKLNSDFNNNHYDNNSYFNKYSKYKKKYLGLKEKIDSINGGNTCLAYGKDAHMFTAFKFEDIKESFGKCDAVNDKKSLQWLRKKIDDNNKKYEKDKNNQWNIFKVYTESSLTIPQLLVVFEDKKADLIKEIAGRIKSKLGPEEAKKFDQVYEFRCNLIPHVKIEDLKGQFMTKDWISILKDEFPITDLKKIYELKHLWGHYSLKELHDVGFSMESLLTYKNTNGDYVIKKNPNLYLKEFTLEQLKPVLEMFKLYQLVEFFTIKELVNAGFSLKDFAKSKKLKKITGKNGETYNDYQLYKSGVFKLEDFKKVYGLKMLNIPTVPVKDMIDKLGFSFDDIFNSKPVRNFEKDIELMKYILEKYNNKTLDDEKVLIYILDLYIDSGKENWKRIPYTLLSNEKFFDNEPPPRKSGKYGIADFLIEWSPHWIDATKREDLGKYFTDYFNTILPNIKDYYTEPLKNEASGDAFPFKNYKQEYEDKTPDDLQSMHFDPTKRQILYILDSNITLQSGLKNHIIKYFTATRATQDRKYSSEHKEYSKASVEWIKVMIEENKRKELKNIDDKEIEEYLKNQDLLNKTKLFIKFKDRLISSK